MKKYIILLTLLLTGCTDSSKTTDRITTTTSLTGAFIKLQNQLDRIEAKLDNNTANKKCVVGK